MSTARRSEVCTGCSRVDEWLQTLTTADAAGAKRFGSTSTRLVRKILSMALEEAVQRGRLPRNPVALTQPPRRDRSRQELGWTPDEARADPFRI